MGYRSDVAIEIHSSDREKFEGLIDEDNRTWEEVREVKCEDISHTIYLFKGVKWYSSYDDVIQIESALNELEEYAFLRIGEDYDDLQFENGLSDDIFIGVVRKVTVYDPDNSMSEVITSTFDKKYYKF